MPFGSKRYALTIIAYATAIVLWSANAAAYQCDGDCEGTGCNGGCTVASHCRVSCTDDGCPGTAICKEYGDHTECYHEFTSECQVDTGGPPDGPEEPNLVSSPEAARGAEWAVIAYPSDEFSPLDSAAAEVLASTSRLYAEHAVDALVIGQRRQSSDLRQRFRAEGQRLPSLPVQRRVRYSVAPAGACVRITLDLASHSLPEEVPDTATIFVRATVDEEGQIAAVELLHSLKPDVSGPMVRFLKANAGFTRLDGKSGPFQAYVVLSAFQGTASWIVSGSRSLL